jgi:DNA-binding response OmpR family regulator
MAAHTTGRQPFILLVEDDEPLRKTIARTLTAAGYMVLGAATFAQALDKMAVKPNLLILDINLPDATGWDVADWLQDQTTQIPIIVISGLAPDHELLRHFKAKAFLPKPFAMRELMALVEQYSG